MEELEEIEDDEVKGKVIQNSQIGFVDFIINNPIPQQKQHRQGSWR
jgi:hypothetical protein